MRSPVSGRALGEWNAIKSRGFGHSELTSVGILAPISALPTCPFLDTCRFADNSSTARLKE